jgi:uncharacterized BrkB/YihY/UPF0761 family membrane protein
MVITNKLTRNPNNSTQESPTKLDSEKFIIIVGTLLVVFFTLVLSLVVRSLFQGTIKLFESISISQLVEFFPVVLVAMISGITLFYLLHFPKVLTQLFQSFWSSIEDEN